MFFGFKERVEDFIVEEDLWFNFDTSWDFLYIFFEKRWQNTMDIVEKLIKKFKLKRHQLGISWLKDKNGITRQWISIGKNTLAQLWWQNVFVQYLSKEVKILSESYHTQLLNVWQHRWNNFIIRLRAKDFINPLLKKQLQNQLDDIQNNGFPNYFGMQRFGKWLKNWKRAVKIFDGWDFDPDNHHLRFQLQSWVSMHFNRMLHNRIEQNIKYLDWDILMKWNNAWKSEAGILDHSSLITFDYQASKKNNTEKDFFYPEFLGDQIPFDETIQKEWIPSWALLWYNVLLPKHGSPAFDFERSYLQKIQFLLEPINICQHVGIYGIRRPYYVFPRKLSYVRDNDDLILTFWLPTGAYATVLLAQLFQKVEAKTYQQYFKLPL